MSWKGFTKGVGRTPQQFKQKFNIGEISKDAFYIDAERRFEELEKETKNLHMESKKYFDSINKMLDHQIEFSKACIDLYKPISGRVSDIDSYVAEGNEEGIKACEEYITIVGELKQSLAPELEMIENHIIKPADELMEIIKVIRKTAQKRDHKKLDYDRHRAVLKKLQDKKDKTLKDEKAIYKAENDVELATQDYNYFNELLKEELPKLFTLEREFIRPLFQSFYYMQLNVFYTLHEKMQNIDIGYFDLSLDIEEAFNQNRGEIQAEVEKLAIVKFKTTGGRTRPGSKYGQRLAIKQSGENPGGRLAITQAGEKPAVRHSVLSPPPSAVSATEQAPPPYSPIGALSPPSSAGLGRTASTGSSLAAAAAAKSKPPPPKPKPARLSGAPAAEKATALYDYEAQAEGDLSFSAGDVIEIVQRTGNTNEWWTGKVGIKQGQFPGNYVQLNS